MDIFVELSWPAEELMQVKGGAGRVG
jgi:hypothetical protein